MHMEESPLTVRSYDITPTTFIQFPSMLVGNTHTMMPPVNTPSTISMLQEAGRTDELSPTQWTVD